MKPLLSIALFALVACGCSSKPAVPTYAEAVATYQAEVALLDSSSFEILFATYVGGDTPAPPGYNRVEGVLTTAHRGHWCEHLLNNHLAVFRIFVNGITCEEQPKRPQSKHFPEKSPRTGNRGR